jgi:penicillin-binding protein 2
VAGKTGTAQVISNQGRQAARGSGLDLRDHGWFVFFAPRDKPEIAGVVFAEHGEHGSSAAPIAKYVMETYFAKRDGLPLPTLVTPATSPSVRSQPAQPVPPSDVPPPDIPAPVEAAPSVPAAAQVGR